MARQTGESRSRIAFSICTNQFYFSVKRPRSRETGVKNDFEEMEHEIPSGTFCLKEQGYLYRCSMLPEIFRVIDPESGVPFTLHPDSPEAFCKW